MCGGIVNGGPSRIPTHAILTALPLAIAAWAVTCGITFTFGGLKVTTAAEVLDTQHRIIPGLFTAGEMLGGLFYFNYPGATGLMSGAVFGRIAGRGAAQAAIASGNAVNIA